MGDAKIQSTIFQSPISAATGNKYRTIWFGTHFSTVEADEFSYLALQKFKNVALNAGAISDMYVEVTGESRSPRGAESETI